MLISQRLDSRLRTAYQPIVGVNSNIEVLIQLSASLPIIIVEGRFPAYQ
jgi:hypothetical protein